MFDEVLETKNMRGVDQKKLGLWGNLYRNRKEMKKERMGGNKWIFEVMTGIVRFD
jgi:hypothetical protein